MNSDIFRIDCNFMLSSLTMDENVDKLTEIVKFIMNVRIPSKKTLKNKPEVFTYNAETIIHYTGVRTAIFFQYDITRI